jgi:hypothetical protein
MPLPLFGFADLEHLGSAGRAGACGGGFLIFHGNFLGILHLFLGPAFDAICFHYFPPFLLITIRLFFTVVNIPPTITSY